jgi:hypothetical protein
MKKFFLAIFLLLLAWCRAQAQLIEDFEGGTPDRAWKGLNGTFNGAVANPDPSGLNTSAWVGSYTNDPDFDFSFALDTSGIVNDLSKNNMVKMKVWSPKADIQILFKFEGPGQQVEKFATLTTANEWVELSFDLSGGANFTNLNAILVSFNSFVLGDSSTYYFDDIRLVKNEIVYEDFEGGSDFTWTSLNGTYNGAVANPDPNQINSSPTVGSFTNNPGADYNFAFGTSTDTFDLSKYNQFSLQLWAPEPTEVLFKIEGTGEAIEKRRNVAVTNEWQEYYFDFSDAADFGTVTKILIVFSPGILGSNDTFYVDNIKAAVDPCPDEDPDPTMIDDFECNRNATYSLGWDSIQVVKNPDPDGVNPSLCVGKWNRPSGPGTEYAAMVVAYDTPLDLSENNQFSIKVYTAKAGTLLVKLEGSVSNPPVEFPVQMTALNEWVEYKVDFSAQAGKGYTALVLFFGAGVNGAAGDMYWFDDLRISQPTSLPPAEDFQDGISLGWQPLDQNSVLNGQFSGPTPNPDPDAVNNSTQVGCYTKGSSQFSTLQAFSLDTFDLTGYPQFDVDVYSATGSGTVLMQLFSATQGGKEAEAEYTDTGNWQTLSFDFSAFTGITDFQEIRLIFNPATAGQGQSWCIDNVRQSIVTADPCADVEPDPAIIDDFECQRNFLSIYYGTADLAVVNNPHITVENGSTRVGEYNDPEGPGTEYAGIGYEFAIPPDLTTLNQVTLQVWSPEPNVIVLIKLEGGTAAERFDTITEANKWVTISGDFSDIGVNANTKLVLFFEPGSVDGGNQYFIDNLRFSRPGYTGCFSDFESPVTTIDNFVYFNQDPNFTEPFQVVPNPDPDAVNMSANVGKFVQGAAAPIFTGMFADLDAPIDFRGNKTMRVKVYMDHLGSFTLKVENFGNNPPAVEITVMNTLVNQWEELTFDFAAAPDDPAYKRFTILVDIGSEAPGTNRTTYFDDIIIGTGECNTIGVFNPTPVAALSVSPNPVAERLFVENAQDIYRFEVVNLFGQRLGATENARHDRADIDVTRLPAGVYLLTGYDRRGVLAGQAKFVKQ